MKKSSKIYLAGHTGMVGSAILRNLKAKGYTNILTRNLDELDLLKQAEVERFFDNKKPDIVIDAAAKVGGIIANNTYRADFLYENLMIQNNIIHNAYRSGVEKLLFLGSSCIYPKEASQPMKEESLLTGPLEPTNEPYAIAKIAGIKMCENFYNQYGKNFISVMPTNLFGIYDNFDLENSHVLPALLRKFHEAKKNNEPEVIVWGTGTVKREFLFVDDMADACVYLLENIDAEVLYNNLKVSHINIGTGEDITISELAHQIKQVVGYLGDIIFDTSKPDGMKRKLLDVSRLHNVGWHHKYTLQEGLERTYEWYINAKKIRGLM